MTSTSNPRASLLPWCLLLLVASLVPYYQALLSGFVLDDWPVIVENPAIRSLDSIASFFTQSVWSNTPERSSNFIYRPLFLLTQALNYQLWGLNPLGYHLLNLALHCANTLLLLLILRRLLPAASLNALGLACLLFALHPTHVESVNWIAGVTDPQLTALILISFYAYLRGDQRVWLLLSWVAFALALLAKEVAVSFPLLLLALHLLRRQPLPWARWLPFLGLTLAYFILRSQALGSGVALGRFNLDQLPLLLGFSGQYLQLLVIPWPSAYYYNAPMEPLSILIGWLVILGLGLLCWRAWQRAQWVLLLGGAWFAASLAPALALALLDNPTFAQRFLYLPSAGAAIALAAVLSSVRLSRPLYAGLGLAALLFAGLCVHYSSHWKSDQNFYLFALENSGQHRGPIVGLARTVAREEGSLTTAQLLELIEQRFPDPGQHALTLETVGTDYGQRGQLELSDAIFRHLLDRYPDYAMGWFGLGNLAWMQKDLKGAVAHYLRAAQLQPRDPQICQNLQAVLRAARDPQHRSDFQRLCRD
ncbi:tetratricopeptide repeat protein [Aestuariirhabdus litorea]|uniref:Uncharacterized protein n=1 Tax=Aestuariirhabdus litorea TaxID=2528527 RepID=A0A3P3VRE1_9GAMM|nr:tetratricopeptide repeat protein [Aestuariirhabdus litorea]RRJ85305.1 hypothetical protein D0544_09665 [Aestuariirhabdus litorea]RWW98527.1 tetratricopeptide repeat protein [Endozoicomonadaceae bacterium GTF-13]